MALPIEQQGLYQDGNSIFENVFIQGTLNVATTNEKIVVRSNGITIDNNNGIETLRILSNGNVGIGSVIPTDILDIQTGLSDEVTKFKVKTAGQLELTRNHASAPYIKTLMSSGNPNIILGDSGGDKVLINGDGASYFNGGTVGINSTSPAATLDIRDVGSTGPGILISGCTGTEGDLTVQEGEILHVGHFNSDTNTFTERLRMHNNGQVAIGQAGYVPQRTLDVIGSIRKTVYEPGEIIEQLETQADGNAVTVQSGTYTPTNVTAIQNLTTTHAVINGSSFDYTPPTGTTRLIYEFWVYMRDTDVGPLLHFQGRVDGTVVNNSRHTWRGATASADYQMWIYSKMILRVGVTESLSAGDVGTWTSAKTIDFTAREYSSTNEGRFHKTNNWDGTGTDIVVKPRIRITAIA